MLSACVGESVDAFNIRRSLVSRRRRCPGASTLMTDVEGGTRIPGITSLYVKFKQEKHIPSPKIL
jgi:hypothetical protein